jgi:Zn-dependent M28 family amino/carboxypeptidase
MINLDMIGHLGEGVYSTSEMIESSLDLKQIVTELGAKYSFAGQISNYGSRDGGSDHVPFYNKGVPVVFLHTGLHKYYHTPGDTVDTLNFQGIEQVSRFAMELAWKANQYGDKIKFNYASFIELPIVSDHGMNETPFQHGE